MMSCLIFVLVFQQIDDLTDHDQNRAQTHRLTSISILIVSVQQLGCRFVQQRRIVQQLLDLARVISQIEQRQHLVFGHTHGLRSLDQKVGLPIYCLRLVHFVEP